MKTEETIKKMYKKIIPYNTKLKEHAKYLRKNSTLSEILLWKKIKNKQIRSFDFDRQKPIDNYIVDFFCAELMLAIEIDGSTHFEQEKYDNYRQKRLESLGVNFLRFGDIQIKKNANSAVLEILDWIEKNGANERPTPPIGTPPKRGLNLFFR